VLVRKFNQLKFCPFSKPKPNQNLVNLVSAWPSLALSLAQA